MTRNSLALSGGIDAYGFYVEVALHFNCEDCGEHMECPVSDLDDSAPNPPWATREGRRGMSLGWWVPASDRRRFTMTPHILPGLRSETWIGSLEFPPVCRIPLSSSAGLTRT